MRPPGTPRPFRGAQYDKDMFTFLPARFDRDVLAESSRKRKSSSSDHHLAAPAQNVRHGISGFSNPKHNDGDLQSKEIQSSAQSLRPRESSKFKGYSEQSRYWDKNDRFERRPRNERSYNETRSEYARHSSSSGRMQSPPNHKVSSPLYDRPARLDRDVLAESSRKRKVATADHHLIVPAPNPRHRISKFSSPKRNASEIQCSVQALRPRELSNFKGHSEQRQNWDRNDYYSERRPRNERGFYETRSEYTSSSGRSQSPNHKVSSPLYSISKGRTHKTSNLSPPVTEEDFQQYDQHETNSHAATLEGLKWPQLLTEDFSRRENRELNYHGGTHRTLDWQLPVVQGTYQHERLESNAHAAKKSSNWPPLMTKDFFQYGNCESNAHLATHKSLAGPPPMTHKLLDGPPPMTHKSLGGPPMTHKSLDGPPPMTHKSLDGPPPMTHKSLDGPPPVTHKSLLTEDFSQCENRELNDRGGTRRTLDWQPPVVQGSYQHEHLKSNAHVAQKSSNWPPLMTKDFFQHGNCESNAHVETHKSLEGPPPVAQDLSHHENNSNADVARVKNSSDSQDFWRYAQKESVQPRAIASNLHEHSSKKLGESQRLPQHFLKAGVVIGGLDEKGRYEEESYKVDCSSNVKEYGDAGRVAEFDSAETYKVESSSNLNRSDIESFVGSDNNKTSGNNAGTSVCNIQTVTNNLLNVLRLLSAASGVGLADSDGNIQGCGHDAKMMKVPPGSAVQNLSHPPIETNLSKKLEDGFNLDEPAADGEKGSVKVDDECKFDNGASAFSEKLWDGTLQLSTSISVSVIAFFKSGEKMQDFSWSESVEVKGKVRLEAFEKYVQDLPRSRSRGLMVMSLCSKHGSSDAGHISMKEVARRYKEGKRVGFAKLSTDVDVYICPHSDAIITILAKHGFFKGIIAIKDQSEPLLGCVVWKKSSSSASASASAKQAAGEVSTAEKDQTPVGGVENNSNSVSSTELKTRVEANKQISVSCKQSADFSDDDDDDDDLPEYDFTAAISQASASKTSTEVQQNSEAHKSGFPIPNQDQKQLGHIQGPALQNLGQQSEGKGPSLPTQEQNPVEKDAAILKTINLFDDDDMPEWCPPDIIKMREEAAMKRAEVSFPLSNSNVPGSGFADLTSGFLLPPPPPPPPLTQMQFQGKNSSQVQFKREYPSAPHVLPPPPPPLTQMQVQRIIDLPAPPLPNPAASGFMPETPAAVSTQMSLKERDYHTAPNNAPPPPVGKPTANNFMHQSPAASSAQMQFRDQNSIAISSQLQFKERDYPSAPLPPQSPAARSTQVHFGAKIYSTAPRDPRSFPGRPASDALIHQNPAFPPGFAPNLAFRPCFDQPGMKNPVRPSAWSTRP